MSLKPYITNADPPRLTVIKNSGDMSDWFDVNESDETKECFILYTFIGDTLKLLSEIIYLEPNKNIELLIKSNINDDITAGYLVSYCNKTIHRPNTTNKTDGYLKLTFF